VVARRAIVRGLGLSAMSLLGARLRVNLLGRGPAGLLGRARIVDVLIHLISTSVLEVGTPRVTGPTATVRTNLRRDGLDCARRAGDNGRYPAGPDDSQLLLNCCVCDAYTRRSHRGMHKLYQARRRIQTR
jgi:hypothetical protein